MSKSFSLIIKNEIISRKLNPKARHSLLAGIFQTCKIQNQKIKLTINNLEIFTYLENALNKENIPYSKPRKNSFLIDVSTFDFENIIKQTDFYSGIFIIAGSISDAKSTSYHLEIRFQEENKAYEVQESLSKYDFDFHLLKRNSQFILYLKKIENICDFLKAIGAFQAYMDFEEIKIERDINNSSQRLANFDFYNQERIATANAKFLENLKYIREHKLLNHFHEYEVDFFRLKEENLDLSLHDLSLKMKEIGEIKAKTTLAHYLVKLRNVVKKHKKNS
ncbi:hypothetical protein JN00_0188 [Metamycoplasma subdolum]|uniref:Probable cell division protein WhiA n=1 Tax=Metamycoplasma subdolum TaxID=92407 RepID=A0A3M0A420_9BACT|nr:DNA-binding protein WhiA [Metamycoplasma subdolum]RMA79134.1 hypothetical protein JN00_0188 [Metamycoplasma subdolum]WPB50656.1 DNA-binding protein WhiA [Metamycoplasma subdolum]